MTKIIATMCVRNEADILPYFLDHMQAQSVEQVIAIDTGSTDGTWEMLRSHKLVSQSWRRPSDCFDQGTLMSELSDRAYRAGAAWVVNTDADELWHGLDFLHEVPAMFNAVATPLFNHLATPGDEPFHPDRCRRVGQQAAWKVAHRAAPHLRIEAGNHGVNVGPTLEADAARLHIAHYPARSRQQFRRKIERAQVVLPSMRPHEAGHWRHWVAELQAGRFDRLYDHFTNLAAEYGRPEPAIS